MSSTLDVGQITSFEVARLVALPHGIRARLAELVPAADSAMFEWQARAAMGLDQTALALAWDGRGELLGWAGASAGQLGVFVAPARRRTGLGSRLLRALFAAGHTGAYRARDAAGQAFYQRLGARPFGTRADPLHPPACQGSGCGARAAYARRTGTLVRLSHRDYFCARCAAGLMAAATSPAYWGHPAWATLEDDTLG